MANPWEKNDPLVSPIWEANDPLVSSEISPSEVNPWEANDLVVESQPEDTRDNLFARFGKQVYNVAIAAPVQAIGTESTLGETNTLMNTIGSLGKDVQRRFGLGEPLTQAEVDFWSKTSGWGEVLKRDYEAGVAPLRKEYTIEERLGKLNTAAIQGKQKTIQDADISATVTEASNWLETGTDVVAGITGFVAQLAALKKAVPSLPQIGIWELQNQIEGGTPGMGALQYAAFAGPAKLIPGKGRAAEIGKTALQSGAFASINAVEQMIDEGEIDPVSVLIAAGIPVGLKVAGGAAGRLKRLIKSKNPKVMKALNEKYPETLSTQPEFTVTQGGKTLAVDTRGINVQKAAWENQWGGRNATKLKSQMQGLLDKVKGEKNVSKLTALADDMEKLDIEISRIAPENLRKAGIKKLHSLARKHRIDVPKGTTKTGLKRLLAGQQDVVETESGYAVRNLLSKGKAGTAWEIDRYGTRAEALEVFHNQQVAMHEAMGRGTGAVQGGQPANVFGGKPRVRVAAEVGKTTGGSAAPVVERGLPLVTGPGATSIEETTKTLVKWSNKAKPLNTTEVAAAVKANQKRQVAAGMSATRKAIIKGHSAHDSIIKAMGAMKGKANTPQVTPPNLSTAQWEAIERKAIEIWPHSRHWFKIPQTFKIIDKLKGGNIPTNYEFGLLEELLGRKAIRALHAGIVPAYDYSWADAPWLIRDILKMRFAYDPQASWLRQTSGIAGRHPRIADKAFSENVVAYTGERWSPSKRLRRVGRRALGKKNPKFESPEAAGERINAAIENHPVHERAKKYVPFLGTTPWASHEAATKLQQYGHAGEFLLSRTAENILGKPGKFAIDKTGRIGKAPLEALALIARKWGQWISASERGANAGMNTATHLLWLEGEKDLARDLARKAMTPAQIDKWYVDRGRDIMTGLKRRTAFSKQGKQFERAANWIMFSPANTWSRMIQPFQIIKRLATGKGFERTYAAEILVSNIAKISLMGSIAAYTGHRLRANDPTQEPHIDGSNDPTNPMWGKTRVGNDVFDPSGGDASTFRAFARIGQSSYMYGREFITGQESTAMPAGEIFKRWLNNRETVILGLGKTLLTGKDWLGRPIDGMDALLDVFPVEFIISMVEAGTADGTWEQLAIGDIQEASKGFISNIPVGVFGLLGGGTGSYPVKATSARYNFKNFIAQKSYDKDWDDLSMSEQRKLSRENRKQFTLLDAQVKAESVESPRSPERQIEEARLSQKKISRLLSKPNRAKVEGISVAVSRRPKNFYLNDERYQKYQELTAKYLNERLTKRNIEGKSPRTKTILLELDIKLAKDKAFRELRKEIR